MNSSSEPWLIVGQGLAGTCLAWHLWWRGVPFHVMDDDRGGSSRIAAGLINPITGKHFEPSKNFPSALPAATSFYRKVAGAITENHWHPLRLVRLADQKAEWEKIQSKLQRPDVRPWIESIQSSPPAGWIGAVTLRGAARLDTRGFLDASRDYFLQRGFFSNRVWDPATTTHSATKTVLCDGAAGILTGRTGQHRCAKGEILTIRMKRPVDHIRIGAGGWLVPVGPHEAKVGSTYEWNRLDNEPTEDGLEILLAKAGRLCDCTFDVIAHEAAIRPILRRSEPLIGLLDSGHWAFNGLGSKGSLHAPSTAAVLADCLLTGAEPPAEMNLRNHRKI